MRAWAQHTRSSKRSCGCKKEGLLKCEQGYIFGPKAATAFSISCGWVGTLGRSIPHCIDGNYTPIYSWLSKVTFLEVSTTYKHWDKILRLGCISCMILRPDCRGEFTQPGSISIFWALLVMLICNAFSDNFAAKLLSFWGLSYKSLRFNRSEVSYGSP